MLHAPLFAARFCSTAWIGAATVFVIVGVREVTRGGFDTATKDALVAIRFPVFYGAGFLLLGCAWLGTWLSRGHGQLSATRRKIALVCLTVALLLMVADYTWVYRPLLELVVPPGKEKPPIFHSYHEASKYVNLVGLLFTLITSVSLAWPVALPNANDIGCGDAGERAA